eukprot:TCONS_00015972-protein
MVVKWIRSIISSSKKLVGKDPFGNFYFEVVKGSGRVQRSFDGQTKHEEYQTGDLPHEWEAWLRGKRTEPPSDEEIIKNLKYSAQVQMRAVKRSAEDDERQAKAYAEGLIQREPPSTGKSTASKSSSPPPGTDSNYQPNSWSPGGGSAAQTEEAKYEPDSWKPGS